MNTDVTDAEAIRGSHAQPTTFVLVYERHCEAVARYLARRVGADLAEDLAAEAWARPYRQRARYRVEHETALPWLYGICSNLIADHRRAERRRLRALERLVADRGRERAAGPPDHVELLAPELVRALRRLSAVDRDALLLVAWGELSYEEAALALEVPVGTVRSRIARARRHLAGDPSCHPVLLTGETHA